MHTHGRREGSVGRSAIFVHSAEQRKTAEALIRELDSDRALHASIVTEATEATESFPAEEYAAKAPLRRFTGW